MLPTGDWNCDLDPTMVIASLLAEIDTVQLASYSGLE